ncbi:hypothetical protein [Bradyrhizobium pachyrhizi]|uniref:hypothetical protein n=1 Tax=Bradyrhizobium pachyrhizi TaxID=280333 RepID=UPI003D364E07
MRTISPILDDAARAGAALGDLLTALLKAIDPGTGWFDEAADGGLGMVMAGLAGVATALLVAILLSAYFRSGYRSTRDIVRHALVTTLVLALLGFAAYDVRRDALAYFGLAASPAATGTLGSGVSPPAASTPAIRQLSI